MEKITTQFIVHSNLVFSSLFVSSKQNSFRFHPQVKIITMDDQKKENKEKRSGNGKKEAMCSMYLYIMTTKYYSSE